MKRADLEFITFDTEDVITTRGEVPYGNTLHYYVTRVERNRVFIDEYKGATPTGNSYGVNIPSEEEASKAVHNWYLDVNPNWGLIPCGDDHNHPF